jgi:NADH-quinone oxidoreductase subunit N
LFWWLAVIGVLNAAAGAYYYLRIVVLMYLRPAPSAPIVPRTGWPTAVAIGACASLSLLIGLFPAPVARASRDAAVDATALPAPETDAVAAVNAR